MASFNQYTSRPTIIEASPTMALQMKARSCGQLARHSEIERREKLIWILGYTIAANAAWRTHSNQDIKIYEQISCSAGDQLGR